MFLLFLSRACLIYLQSIIFIFKFQSKTVNVTYLHSFLHTHIPFFSSTMPIHNAYLPSYPIHFREPLWDIQGNATCMIVVIYKGITELIHYTLNYDAFTMEFLHYILRSDNTNVLGFHWSMQWLDARLVPRHYFYQGRYFASESIEPLIFYLNSIFVIGCALGKELLTGWFYWGLDVLTINI